MEEVHAPDLEVDDAPQFQQRQWRIQRLGWVLLAATVVTALLGFLGPGPMSWSVVGEQALRMEHPRFPQLQAPTHLRFHFQAKTSSPELWVDRKYIEKFKIDAIVPAPRSQRAEADRLIFEFDAGVDAAATAVTFYVTPTDAGSAGARAGLIGGPTLTAWQFIYP